MDIDADHPLPEGSEGLRRDTEAEAIVMFRAVGVVEVDMAGQVEADVADLTGDEADLMEGMEDAEAGLEGMGDEEDMVGGADTVDRDVMVVMDLEDLEVVIDRDLRLVDLLATTTADRTTVLSAADPLPTGRDLCQGQGRLSANPAVEASRVRGRDRGRGRTAAVLAEAGAAVLRRARGGDRSPEALPGAEAGVR